MELPTLTRFTYADCQAMGDTLLYLPQEIRDNIFAHFFETYEPSGYEHFVNLQEEPFAGIPLEEAYSERLPAVCQVYPDAIPEYLKANHFIVALEYEDAFGDFIEYLKFLPITNPFIHILKLTLYPIMYQIQGHDHLQRDKHLEGTKLEFYAGDYLQGNTIKDSLGELFTACTALRNLTVRLDLYTPGVRTITTDDVTIILKKHCLPLLHKLKHLKKLILQLQEPKAFEKLQLLFQEPLGTSLEGISTRAVRELVEKSLKENGLDVELNIFLIFAITDRG